jgi:hypothetical protein
MARIISPDSIDFLKSDLNGLVAGQSICISSRDFKKLTGDDIAAFCSEGRLMVGNLAASSNCTIDTTSGTALFTKNPARPTDGVWTRFGSVGMNDQLTPAKRSA